MRALLRGPGPERIQRLTARRRQTQGFRLAVASPLSPQLATDVCRSLMHLSGGLVAIEPARAPVRGLAPGAVLHAPGYLETGALSPGSILLVRNRLDAPLLATVMGWSETRGGVAIVSASGLEDSPERLAALVGHEAAHLLGLRHCRSRHCLARRVSRPEELDHVRGFCSTCAGLLRR